jgi:hypothetical protein
MPVRIESIADSPVGETLRARSWSRKGRLIAAGTAALGLGILAIEARADEDFACDGECEFEEGVPRILISTSNNWHYVLYGTSSGGFAGYLALLHYGGRSAGLRARSDRQSGRRRVPRSHQQRLRARHFVERGAARYLPMASSRVQMHRGQRPLR